MENSQLPNDVYLLDEVKPTKEDANRQGQVLWFSQLTGWHQGQWTGSHLSNVTHWSYLPDRPAQAQSREVVLEVAFNVWYDMNFKNGDPQTKVLLRLGYMAGAKFESKGSHF